MRIGLIAMSGIRVCDAELVRLGLTLPGFVERSRTIASLPSLALLTLAGMTPRRHDVRYIEVPDLVCGGDLPRDFDLVAISSYSAQIDEAYALARRYRDLPSAARRYIAFIERHLAIPVSIVSVGQSREATIVRSPVF